MHLRKSHVCAGFVSVAVWLSAVAPGMAVVVFRSYEPLGYRCFSGDGPHYDERCHHVYGGYRTCFQIPRRLPATAAQGRIALSCQYCFPNGSCAFGYHPQH